MQIHAAQAKYIQSFGHLDLVAYESGLGLAGTPSTPCRDGFAALIPKVLRDPRVEAIAYRNIVEFAKFNATLVSVINVFLLTPKAITSSSNAFAVPSHIAPRIVHLLAMRVCYTQVDGVPLCSWFEPYCEYVHCV